MENCKDNTTLYISNLNERVAVNELRKALLAVFSQFGRVSDIFASRRYKLRGQAWIVFGNSQSADNALHVLQGLPFYSKPMNIAVALKFPSASMKINSSELPQKSSEQCIHSSGISSMRRRGEDVGIDQEKKGEDREEHKNKLKSAILSVKGLPEATTDQMLSLLFKQFPGFQRVRTDSEKPGLASVQFRCAAEATTALSGLQGFRLNATHTMEIEYAKSAI
jgi:U2 small nuclear ribonucleoprotein B''